MKIHLQINFCCGSGNYQLEYMNYRDKNKPYGRHPIYGRCRLSFLYNTSLFTYTPQSHSPQIYTRLEVAGSR